MGLAFFIWQGQHGKTDPIFKEGKVSVKTPLYTLFLSTVVMVRHLMLVEFGGKGEC